jgi:hypothetical protein
MGDLRPRRIYLGMQVTRFHDRPVGKKSDSYGGHAEVQRAYIPQCEHD